MMEGSDQKQAFAVSYTPGTQAPRLLTGGRGEIAKKILSLAEEYGIPVHQDQETAEVLSILEHGNFIPEELYEAFAVILAGLYRANDRLEGMNE